MINEPKDRLEATKAERSSLKRAEKIIAFAKMQTKADGIPPYQSLVYTIAAELEALHAKLAALESAKFSVASQGPMPSEDEAFIEIIKKQPSIIVEAPVTVSEDDICKAANDEVDKTDCCCGGVGCSGVTPRMFWRQGARWMMARMGK